MRQNASLVVACAICMTLPVGRNLLRSCIDVDRETRLVLLLDIIYVDTRVHLENATSALMTTNKCTSI